MLGNLLLRRRPAGLAHTEQQQELGEGERGVLAEHALSRLVQQRRHLVQEARDRQVPVCLIHASQPTID
ncbi:MAG: hypothetical protein IRY85_07850 [Micromonosporaceae bacterium]|nr:hypothetical protein [Micromonosporaceae bacterium]